MTPEEKAVEKANRLAQAKAAARAKAEAAAKIDLPDQQPDAEPLPKEEAPAPAVEKEPAVEAPSLAEASEEDKKAAIKAKAIALAKKKAAAAKARSADAGTGAIPQEAAPAVAEQLKPEPPKQEQPKQEPPKQEPTKQKPVLDKPTEPVKPPKPPAKKISRKMALSIIFFVAVVLVSSSAFLMKLMVWNGYNEDTKVEKQFRANIQKLKVSPEDLQVRYELLTTMYKKGLHDEAKAQLQYILEHAAEGSDILAKTLYYKALYLSIGGKNEEALAAYQQILKLDSSNGEAWMNVSYLYYSLGQYSEAASAAGKAGLFLPKSPEVPYMFGLLSLKEEQTGEAEVMFKKAIQMDSHHQKSLEMLKQLRKKGGRRNSILIIAGTVVLLIGICCWVGYSFFWNQYDTSSSVEKKVLQLEEEAIIKPNDAANQLDLGWSYYEQGKYELAKEQFDQVIKQDSSSFDAQYGIANVHIGLQQYEAAEKLLAALNKIKPGDELVLQDLGIVEREQGRYEESIASFQKALQLNKLSADLYYDLALTYEKMQNKQEAIAHYEKAVDFVPNFVKAADGLKRMGVAKYEPKKFH
ncbi:unnamed protein product [Aphanomyces euteiches]